MRLNSIFTPRKLCTGLAAVALTAAGTLAMAAEKWDMPMAYTDSNFHTQNGKSFAEAVTLATGGKLEVKVHGGGSLFKGSEIKRAVQTGQAPIGERIMSSHANEDALFAFDSVPFLATSFEESDKLWQAAKPELEKVMDKHNLVLLYSVPWPPGGIYANKPLQTLSDMEGVKFRSYNNATARFAELAGAVPVQVEASELSQALSTGVAESFMSSGATGYDRKVWEHLSHHYVANVWLPRNYVFVNKQSWDELDTETQNVVRGIALMAEKAGAARSEQLTGWYLEQLAANGMTVTGAGEALKADFQKVGETMTKEWLAQTGEAGQRILDAYKSSL
ncbi:C4-dicarboxylate ABC transporter substrate-binding protein [Motiliproteus coralliicola]|uniref:C4-dicarboxylate ABC transporter substrate-binding protein n=1 Tax=Motiliproteus coralliicola TaxID=2283196 RepID=A0A369WES4_9GAMM|nr:TRAP transporter substrate-binding protein [Motiliproteus coralliicola]RDE19174.1 C4-dicarboxylate ABC transporter substrate-binding protein [Motiliproteus coralliicola]